MPDNGWQEYSQYVLNSLKELKELREQVVGFRIELAVLKVKVALWGAVGGVFGTALGTLIIQLLLTWYKSRTGNP
jgi:hypothetical protein